MNSIEDIIERSASNSELVVNYHDAMELLYIFNSNCTKVYGWEGWLKFPDGKLSHSLRYQGIADLSELGTRAAIALVKSTIIQSYAEWNESKEADNAELLFCITTNT